MLEQQAPEDEQIVVVDEVPLRLPLGEVGVDAGKVGFVFGESREFLAQDVGHRDLGVHVARVDVMQRLLVWEPSLAIAVAELGARELYQVRGIALVHDCKVTGETGRRTEPAK